MCVWPLISNPRALPDSWMSIMVHTTGISAAWLPVFPLCLGELHSALPDDALCPHCSSRAWKKQTKEKKNVVHLKGHYINLYFTFLSMKIPFIYLFTTHLYHHMADFYVALKLSCSVISYESERACMGTVWSLTGLWMTMYDFHTYESSRFHY